MRVEWVLVRVEGVLVGVGASGSGGVLVGVGASGRGAGRSGC